MGGGIFVFFDVYKSLCNQKKKSMSAVAVELGINKSNVTAWKNNGSTPQGDTLKAIADYFGVSTDFLLEHNVPETKKAPVPEDEGLDRISEIWNALGEEEREKLLTLGQMLKEGKL